MGKENLDNNIGIVEAKWRHEGAGSIYAVGRIGWDKYIVGGSTWRRREDKYSDQLAREEPGAVYTITIPRGSSNVISDEENALRFPSMVNAIASLGERFIICCKYGEQTFNLIDPDLNLLKTADDHEGKGAYNGLFDNTTSELVAVTRSGRLEYVDPRTLQIKASVQLADINTRLWSLSKVDDGGFVCGDYDGNLYFVKDKKPQRSINLVNFADENINQSYRQYKPSVFGLTFQSDGRIVAGIRWGEIMWLNTDLELERSVTIPWEISYLETLPQSKDLLIGTRQGRLLILREGDANPLEVYHIWPALQSDNSIWSILFISDTNCLVTFSDGQIVSLDFAKK